ncbi:hypothetical protein LSUE1_G004250 [Lachnellula suecica]|uniref:Uncharacterized protein n=1 Tax=Lachnellula suecica TaxID=602035 RepID=A0A8T9CD61_9HELO|nr:hypothetical protein LSUE1_G004250 [Lachnellula suecica]
MPALSSTSLALLNTFPLIARDSAATNATTANATSNALQVICAWPVSGQYGPGSRVLYYVLIAACIFARKAEWLRNACLAAALLFPAVAAIHGIVLAAIHPENAVDMDVYGAFQLCSIGILAAPVTVRISRTYFYDPGRNAIFLWTSLILAGLLSLAVQFFRIKTFDCTHDDFGNPISTDIKDFPYGNATCGLTCSVEAGPFSPMRGGSANNIYVIPAPNKLTFGEATLLAAACCIPAILSLVSMWNKILEINWKSRFGGGDGQDELIEGTNGATVQRMKGINALMRSFLSTVEVPVFGAAVLAILILGERNFFTNPTYYQTEPIASIGQWAPIVGAGLAVLGSLSLFLAKDLDSEKEESRPDSSIHHCHCNHSMQEIGGGLAHTPHAATPPNDATELHRSFTADARGTSMETVPTAATHQNNQLLRSTTASTTDAGNRKRVATALTAIVNHLGTAAHFDDSEFKHGKALDFPEIPGEQHRNPTLPQIREQYNQHRDSDEPSTPILRERHSRASFTGSINSGLGIERYTTSPRAASPHSPQSPRSPSPYPRSSTLPVQRTSSELHNPPSPSSPALSEGGARPRRDTLEVPSPVHPRFPRP